MIRLVVTLMLAQTPPSRADMIGSLNTLQTAVLAARAGTRTYTQNAAKTRLCINPATTIPSGAVTVRYGAIILSPQAQQFLGFSLPAGATTWAQATDQYAAMEVQAVPTEIRTFDRRLIIGNLDWLEDELDLRVGAAFPACEVALIRRDDSTFANAVRCACRVDATCLWDPDDAGPLPQTIAPIGLTLPPNSFTGAGCKRKPCVMRFDGSGIDKSWPAECPK